jgi:hypothetical protein
VIEEDWNFIAQLFFRLRIRYRDASATFLHKESGGHSGLTQSDHQNAFISKIHLV